jgi:hypothetical protein
MIFFRFSSGVRTIVRTIAPPLFLVPRYDPRVRLAKRVSPMRGCLGDNVGRAFFPRCLLSLMASVRYRETLGLARRFDGEGNREARFFCREPALGRWHLR